MQSVFTEVFGENTKASPHCTVFIMHEYHAEFQFCKVILHLLSDAGASKRRFLNTLCIEAEAWYPPKGPNFNFQSSFLKAFSFPKNAFPVE